MSQTVAQSDPHPLRTYFRTEIARREASGEEGSGVKARTGSDGACQCGWCRAGKLCPYQAPKPSQIEVFGSVENYGAEWPY